MKSDKKFIVLYAFVVIILLVHYFYLPENGFRFNDAGHKYIQMRSIYENKWQDVSISYPGISIDPGFKLIRTVFGHKNGKLYGFYQPLFAFMVSLLYPFLGARAVFFLPMLSFFISVIILHKILIIVARDRSFRFILLFIYAFASPVILYSFMFWEHTTALMMMMLSLLYFVKYDYVSNKISDLLMTSVFIFISVIFRSEMLMFAVPYMILIGVYLFLNKKKREFKTVSFIILLLFAGYIISNLLVFGNTIFSTDVHYTFTKYLKFIRSIDYYFFGVFIILSVFLALIYRTDNAKWKERDIIILIPIIWLGYVMKYYRAAPVIQLLIEFPVFLLIFYDYGISTAGETEKFTMEHFIKVIIIIFMTLAVLVSPFTPHRSVRYYLPVIPLVIVFLAIKYSQMTVSKRLYMKILVLLAAISMSSVFFRYTTDIIPGKKRNAAKVEFIQKHTKDRDIIIFPDSITLEFVAHLYFTRIFFVWDMKKEKKIDTILDMVSGKDGEYCYLWTENKGIERFIMDSYAVSNIYYFDAQRSLIKINAG